MTLVRLLATCCCGLALMAAPQAVGENPQPEEADTVLDFKMKSIDGKDVDLADYKGTVVMMVNVASECGLTPQYEQLQDIYEKYRDEGFTILGFPANNFMGQEPGTDEEIKAFCKTNYGVEFDMFSKISVKGDDQHPLYAFLTSEETNKEFAGPINWNFEKFLLNRDGEVIARFHPKVKPDAPEVIQAIESALKAKKETPAES